MIGTIRAEWPGRSASAVAPDPPATTRLKTNAMTAVRRRDICSLLCQTDSTRTQIDQVSGRVPSLSSLSGLVRKGGGLSTASSNANASERLACRDRLCDRGDNTQLLHQAQSIPVRPTLDKLSA